MPQDSADSRDRETPVARPRVRRGRRTANACVACRRSKIKCSGEEPCNNCERRLIPCRFASDDQKVTVSKRFIRELQKQARKSRVSTQASTAVSANHEIQEEEREGEESSGMSLMPFATPEDEHIIASDPTCGEILEDPASFPYTLNVYTSPFSTTSSTVRNSNQNRRSWIWLAPSSTWSFTARLTLMLGKRLHVDVPEDLVSTLWGDTYTVEWSHEAKDSVPDISGLPPLDHALYLYNTVKFHLGQHYRFFDDESFLGNLNEFYCGDALQKVTECRLWFVQFLLILAFGNAFLSRSRNPREPPGAKYFIRAMSLLPDLCNLWKDSLLAMEVLSQAALYLYSMDYRESAHIYVGQALKIAQLEGLHTQLPEHELSPAVVARCRNLWWTLYTMDRHFASSIGIPPTTTDSDVTTLKNPSGLNQEDVIFGMQSKLWHLLSMILSTIYKTEKTELGSFLETTMSLLQTMAGHAQEIEGIFNFQFEGSMDTMSKGTRHITLLYHQCVIVATRPLLLSVLQERLDNLEAGQEDWKSFLSLTNTLISTGIKSATKTLQILSHEESLLEAFLPFDLDFVYGAALHLIMADALFASAPKEKSSIHLAHAALDEMIMKGNRVAEVRKSELVRLEGLCHELAKKSDQQGLQTLSLLGTRGTDAMGSDFMTDNLTGTTNPVPATLGPGFATVTPITTDDSIAASTNDLSNMSRPEVFGDVGISPGEFFSIVDHMESQDIFSNGLFEDLPNLGVME